MRSSPIPVMAGDRAVQDEGKPKEQLILELADTRQQLAALSQAEAQREWADLTLRSIVEGTAWVTGDDFFRSLVRHLASALQVRYALITECTDARLTRVRTLAFWTGDGFGENFEYALADTPCQHVVGGEVCYHPDRVQALFPKDEDLRKLKAESYLGIPIRSSSGAPLGHLAVLDDKPMANEPRGVTILQIFAARAGAELERLRAEQALRESEARLQAAIESLPFNLWACDQEGRYIQQNSSSIADWGNLIGKRLEELELNGEVAALWRDHNRRVFAGEVIKEEVSYTRGGETKVFYDIVAPIRFENQVRGILGVNIDITERKRAEARLERNARQLATLSQMGQTVAASLDLTEVLKKVIAEVSPLLDAEGVSILLRANRDELVFAATSESDVHSLLGQRMAVTAGVAGEVIRTGQPVWARSAEDRTQIHQDLETVSRYHTQSLLAVPLKLGDEVIGVMQAVHRQPDAFSADDLYVLEAAANWAAIAIGNARLFEQVRVGRERLRQLTQQVVAAQEEERQRVSRELHDEAGQALTALKISLELIQADLPPESASLRLRMGEAVALTDRTMEHIRLLAQGLRPPALDAVGLALTLEGFCRDFAERTRLSIHYTGVDLPTLPDAVSIALYRFLQEALTNVVKHANANTVWVTLRCDADQVSLSIEDDGRGFDEPAWRYAARQQPTGIGLLGMQERFELLGGRLNIESRLGHGTHLTAYVPAQETQTERA